MKIDATIELFFGGEGSGPTAPCPQCGPKPKPGESAGTGKGQYGHFGNPKSKKILGLWTPGGAIGNLYKHMMTGDWHSMTSLQGVLTALGSTAVLQYRLSCINKIGGHLGGQWKIEYKKQLNPDTGMVEKYARLVMKKATDAAADQVGITGDQQKAALKAVQSLLGGKGLDTVISKQVFDQFMKDAGLKTLNDVATAVKSWTGSAQSMGGSWLRKIACEYYGRDFAHEYDGAEHNTTVMNGEVKADVRDQVLAVKALATEYARADGTKFVYRGMSLGQKWVEKIKEAKAAGKEYVPLPINALSSWSTSQDKASSFGGTVVLRREVDPESVWFTHKAMGHLFSHFQSEKEWIVGSKERYYNYPIKDVWLKNYEYKKPWVD